jgi:hypothetical protein
MKNPKGQYSMKNILIIFCFLSISYECSGYADKYIPLNETELKKHFNLKRDLKLGYEFIAENTGSKYILDIGDKRITISAKVSDDERPPYLEFSGVNKKNMKWEIITDKGYYIYHGDLDKNGQQDIVIVSYTGGCGMAPSTHILTFMFDDDGLPVPFACDSYSDAEENFVDDITDIDGDGKAVLIHMTFGDGYWVTSLYKAGNARWLPVRGIKYNKEFPCYTRFSFKENHKPTKLKQGKSLYAPDLSNATLSFKGVLKSFKMANIEQSEPVELKISDNKNEIHNCFPNSWESTCNIVIDSRDERRVVNYGAGQAVVENAYNEIYKGKYELEIFGNRESADKCDPELIWAKEKDE